MIASAPSGLDFTLPPELEAREPPEARGLPRDGVRLLVTSNDQVVHALFRDLPELLRPGDLLVANESATIPAALEARRPDGSTFALHLSTRQSERVWVVEPRKTAAASGEQLLLPGGGTATLLTPYRRISAENDQRREARAGSRASGPGRLWLARLDLPEDVLDYLHHHGRPIAYDYVRGTWPIEAYQTVYGCTPGSAEMPSAGRAFSHAVLRRLEERGIGFAKLVLHTGVSSLEEPEPPYDEPYAVPARTAEGVNRAKAEGRRVIAVGTTVVRALETAADRHGLVRPQHGWTDLVITPERGVKVVDGLLTGFHEPRASHLAMLEAIAGRAHLERAYAAALADRYLWHEFGDLHLIL